MGVEIIKARPMKRFKCDICSRVEDIEYEPKEVIELIEPAYHIKAAGWKRIGLYFESAEGGVRIATEPRDEVGMWMLTCPSRGCQLLAFKRIMSGVSGEVLGLL